MSDWKETAHKLPFDEVRNLKARVADLKGQLKPHDDGSLQNRPDLLTRVLQIKQDIKKMEKQLDLDDQLIAKTPADKDRYNKEGKELERKLKEVAPSRNSQWTTSKDSMAYERAVGQMMHWQSPAVVHMICRWQELKRRLDPDNPFTDRTDNLMSGFQKVPS